MVGAKIQMILQPNFCFVIFPCKELNFQKQSKTRLEILSRPKAPQILQEQLSNSEELPSPRPTKLLKNSKRF